MWTKLLCAMMGVLIVNASTENKGTTEKSVDDILQETKQIVHNFHIHSGSDVNSSYDLTAYDKHDSDFLLSQISYESNLTQQLQSYSDLLDTIIAIKEEEQNIRKKILLITETEKNKEIFDKKRMEIFNKIEEWLSSFKSRSYYYITFIRIYSRHYTLLLSAIMNLIGFYLGFTNAVNAQRRELYQAENN